MPSEDSDRKRVLLEPVEIAESEVGTAEPQLPVGARSEWSGPFVIEGERASERFCGLPIGGHPNP